jgi:hypothetical protein
MGYVQEKSVSISSLSPGYVAYLLPVQNAGANAFGHHVVLFPSPDPFSTKVQLIHRGEGEPRPLVFVQTLSILHVLLQIRLRIMLSSC